MEFKFLIGMIDPYGRIAEYGWLEDTLIEVRGHLYDRNDVFMAPIDNNGITFYSNGNVGIGVTNPQQGLDVYTVNNVGMGTTNPQQVLDVYSVTDLSIAITSGVRIIV